MTSKSSKFQTWFVLQHGKRENGILSQLSDQRLSDEVQRGKMAAAELEARKLWDEKRESALYAWTAKDTA